MRVKRGTTHTKRRKNILSKTKGYKWGRKNLIKLAQNAETKAGAHAYRDRRVKKRTTRRVWNVKINAGARAQNVSYSKLIKQLKDAKVELDRKSLAYLAEHHPAAFATLVKEVSGK